MLLEYKFSLSYSIGPAFHTVLLVFLLLNIEKMLENDVSIDSLIN